MKKILFPILLLTLGIGTASAQSTWVADKAHTDVLFTVTHMVISEVTGRFTDFDITVEQKNPADFLGATFTAEIKTASVNTDNEGRDKHLRSDDFFNAEKFPVMKFKSTSVEKTGAGSYKITGDLTIRDVTKQVVLDAKYNGQMKDPWGNTKAGFKATTTINRMDYGVKWSKALDAGGYVVADDVTITLLVQLQLKK